MAVAVTPATLPDAQVLTGQVRDASVRVLVLWSRSGTGLGIRFTALAFGLYGLTRRTAKYARKHPAPYVDRGRFRNDIAAGHGVKTTTQTRTDGYDATLVVPAARILNFARGGGIYLREWQRLYGREAETIDGLVAKALPKLGHQWTKE